ETHKQPTYIAKRVFLNLYEQNQLLITLIPERRLYHANGVYHGETALASRYFSQIQTSLGESDAQGHWSVLFIYHPWVNL
ncbi:cytochrome c-type biogenesis CcmF C-terminal domain-containing protein, partial [Acinetobacter baumannii]